MSFSGTVKSPGLVGQLPNIAALACDHSASEAPVVVTAMPQELATDPLVQNHLTCQASFHYNDLDQRAWEGESSFLHSFDPSEDTAIDLTPQGDYSPSFTLHDHGE